MAKRLKNKRTYIALTRPQIQCVEPKTLEIKEISNEDVKVVSDSSIGLSVSKATVWIENYRHRTVKEENYSLYLQSHESEFVDLLLREDFSDSMRNPSTSFIMKLRKGHQKDVNEWLGNLYVAHQDSDYFIIQMLRLFRCFPYEYFAPASLFMAYQAVYHVSDYVKSEALSLLDHWGNFEVFNMLNYHEPPQTPWLRAKYLTVREALKRYAAIQKDRRVAVV